MTSSRQLVILTTEHLDQWQEAIDKIGNYDTYHLPSYNRLAELHKEGQAYLLIYTEDQHTIAFPMLLRDIELPQQISGFDGIKDTSSAYGYGGPISTPDLADDVRGRFLEALQDFLNEKNVVAAFSRLHPIVDNEHLLNGLGEIREFGTTVMIDLTLPPHVQYSNYRRCHKQSVQRLQDRGFECAKVGKERIEDFVSIYYETMNRNEADPYYYFDRSYLEYLVNDMSDNTCLMFCFDKSTPISCCLAFHCKGIVQAHIGGTLDRYLPLAPMKLVLDSLRLWANQIKAYTLNLGGGVGGWRDNVLAFKQGFSKMERPCSVWRHVVQPQLYDDICSEMINVTGIDPEEDYFPFYRNPAFNSND